MAVWPHRICQTSRWGRAGYLADEFLPLLAAGWLTEGHGRAELREPAGLPGQESRQSGRHLFSSVLASLAYLT
jgi:hypothetical protein